MNERMPCSITDGPQYDDDIPPLLNELDDGDPDHEQREEWIRDRDECLRTVLKTRISAAIKRISDHGSFDSNELIQLLKDCKREIA